MLERMESGEIYGIVYCSLNIQKNKGGERLEMPECVLLKPDEEDELYNPNIGRNLTVAEEKEMEILNRKKPNHNKHFTRNMRMYVGGYPTSTIRTVHIRLIERYNGMQVLV